MHARSTFGHGKIGSVLLVSVLLCTGLALALGSFIVLAINSSHLSNRSFSANGCLDIGEAGLEEDIYALNHSDWTGWTTHSSGSGNKQITLPTFDLGQGATGTVKVVVFGATTSATPTIIAEGKITPRFGPPISKQLKVVVGRRSHFANGLVAKDTITFSGGNAEVDSFISDDPNFSGTGGVYDASKRRDRGSAASINVTTDAISLSNADIWGYAATGRYDPTAGPNGTILGADSPVGIKIDPARITHDFTANFDPETTALTGLSLGNVDNNDVVGSGGTEVYVATSVSNSNGKNITINGNITLIVTGSIDIKGGLTIPLGSSLTVYTAGDVVVGGNGVANETGLAKNFVIYGTATTPGAQKLFLHGNGVLVASVYAPNADIELKGGGNSGEMSGSVVGNTIKMTGNYKFHYDEALAKETGGNPFAISSWRELLTASERVTL
jgi:hypothetical protein